MAAAYVELADGVLNAAEAMPEVASAVVVAVGGGAAAETGRCGSLVRSWRAAIEWLRTYPIVHRVIVRIVPGVAAVGLFYADLVFDVLLAVDLFATGNTIWGALTVTFISLQYVAAWLGVLLWLHAQFGIGCEWQESGSLGEFAGYSRATTLFLLFGFPLGPLLLDVVMFLEPLTLLHLLPSPRSVKKHGSWGESLPVPDAGLLRVLIPSYRATRILIEVTLEGLPQSVLQAYIFKRVVIDSVDSGVDVSRRLLIQSLVISLFNLLKVWVGVVYTAHAAEVGMVRYLLTQLRMGVGIPLDAMRRDALTE